MKFKDYLQYINNIAEKHPESLEYEVIYSHDDEGNEYQKVNNYPDFLEIDNIEDDRFLEIIYEEDDETKSKNFNSIIIN